MAFVGLFFASVFAWMDGDDSMAWYVILVIAIFAIGAIGSALS